MPDERLLYRLKRCWRDGTSHVIFTPGELIEKLAALVPQPRFNNRLKEIIAEELTQAQSVYEQTQKAARVFKDFRYQT